MMTSISRIVVLCALAACADRTPTPRFANQPVTEVVNDRRDTPTPPAYREFARFSYHFRGNVIRRLTRGMELRAEQRSLGVNAMDEVPNTTWFTNRIGVRDMSPAEVRTGAATVGSPELHKPWTINSTKIGGASVGFIISDARGEKFILKFDKLGHPETETASHVITGQLLHAVGYNTPEDHIVYLRKSDLVLSPKAKIKDFFGNSRKLEHAELETLLAKIEIPADGNMRGLVSRLIDGKPLGGPPAEGVRADDPNDLIPHERRRELRGAYAIFSWLDHIDIKEDNFLDAWVADPANPKHHYVKHYALDFGSALGVMAAVNGDPRRGHAYELDAAESLTSLATLGLYTRPWEGRKLAPLRGVGSFSADNYDPSSWVAYTPSYYSLLTADRLDKLWGAKLVMRFTREQLRAAVDAGRLTDPRAVTYLVDTLVARQRATARYWFSQTNPLDAFEVMSGPNGASVCFDDLMLTYQLMPAAAATRYTITVADRAGTSLAAPTSIPAQRAGRTCTPPVALPAAGDGYSVMKLRTSRLAPATFVHLARRSGIPNVVGIWRE